MAACAEDFKNTMI